MFNWLITMFAPHAAVRVPTVRKRSCIECQNFGVLSACGRQYCKIGLAHLFPDKGCECGEFSRGDNPATIGEI